MKNFQVQVKQLGYNVAEDMNEVFYWPSGTFYTPDGKYRIALRSGPFGVFSMEHIENALTSGTVTRVTVHMKSQDAALYLLNEVGIADMGFDEAFKAIQNIDNKDYFSISVETEKDTKTFSPFNIDKVKPVRKKFSNGDTVSKTDLFKILARGDYSFFNRDFYIGLDDASSDDVEKRSLSRKAALDMAANVLAGGYRAYVSAVDGNMKYIVFRSHSNESYTVAVEQ